MLRHRKNLLLWLLAAFHFSASGAAIQAPWLRPALATAFGSQSVLTAVTHAGSRLVAIGERGIVILSDDQGHTWRQANVPVSVTLCAVQFVDARKGWAVGHSGVILATHDGGVTWIKQLDWRQIPALLRAEAAARGQESLAKAADQFEQDGPDKPFLDVSFVDARRGWVVGSYGLFLRTDDGGKTWNSGMAEVDNPKGLSIYAIGTDGRSMYLAGEQGYFARGSSSGEGFKRVATPGTSSYFTMLAVPGRLLIGGLAGVLLDSVDGGASWRRLDTGTSSSIVSLLWSPEHELMVGGQGGEVMSVDLESSTRLSALALSPARTLHALARSATGQVVTVGFPGVIPLPIPEKRHSLR